MNDSTPRQEDILNLIRDWIETTGLPPENPDFAPIDVDLTRQERVIEGIAVGVISSGKSL